MKHRTWRKLHRYLGLIIGIQLFVWTLSGVVFSWNSMKSVRGEHLIRHPDGEPLAPFDPDVLSSILASAATDSHKAQSLYSVSVRSLLSRPVVELTYRRGEGVDFVVYDLTTGNLLSPIDESTARQIAQHDFAEPVSIRFCEKIDAVSSHSEYRKKELPAYRVGLDHNTNPIIYVSADRGTVTARRNDQWRLYDFFWMLHTMDFWGRDSFNTWLLKSVSMLGLITVITGFIVGAQTSRIFRRTFMRKKKT